MKKFGLIGLPLIHSFSKVYFNDKFEKEGIDATYGLYELHSITEFPALIERADLCGLNVTIPYKEKVIPYLDELDETAAEIGAVNVIKFIQSDGKLKLKGFNTDATGFELSIKPYLKARHKKALILGTGGVSKAIVYVLRKHGIECTFVSRTAKPGILTYSQLNKEIISDHLMIVNASPVGTYPHNNEYPAIPYQFLTPQHFLFDVVYNPYETLFLDRAKEMGAVGLNGANMLAGQALVAWEIWTSPPAPLL